MKSDCFKEDGVVVVEMGSGMGCFGTVIGKSRHKNLSGSYLKIGTDIINIKNEAKSKPEHYFRNVTIFSQVSSL